MFYLIIRYFLDWEILVGKKIVRDIKETEIKKWQQHLINMQPMLQLFQTNNDKGKMPQDAKDILNHNFILFGNKYSFLPNQSATFGSYQKINWHYDPSTESEFSQKGWYRLVRKNLPKDSDIKYPWELSRFHHLILLGKAYTDTNEEKYTLEFINQITDWIENNPVRYGINWSNTMEVGIRAANWTIALLYFLKSNHLTDEFYNNYFVSLQEHGNHIYRNLENLQPINSNHYIGNLFGLYILSSVCSFFDQSKKWLRFSKNELEKEIIKQTYDDGWDYEASTAYHKLVTEMFTYILIIARHFHVSFSDRYVNRLKYMINNIISIKKPDSMIPQIGDNDSGHSLVFNFSNSNLNIQHLFILSKKNALLSNNKIKRGFFKYNNAGYYLYKNNIIYLLINAGAKNIIGLGSHLHNDVLSFILNIDGEDILIDPGTYNYTSNIKKRNHFRSISSHNTLYWDGIEPRSLNDGIFKLVENGKIEVKHVSGDKSGFEFIGRYKYKNRYHQRSISYGIKNNFIEIKDSVSHGKGILNFMLAPGSKPKITETGFLLEKISFEFSRVSNIIIKDNKYSSGYGKIEPNKCVRVFLAANDISYYIKFNK